MSPLLAQRTLRKRAPMSAFGGKADIAQVATIVYCCVNDPREPLQGATTAMGQFRGPESGTD
jgi:hypothetical protein